MKWKPTRIIVLFLGLWVALAPAVIAVPTAAMTMQMSMSDEGDKSNDTGDTGSGCCDGCPDADTDRNVCASKCLNIVSLAIIAGLGKLDPAAFHDDQWTARDLILSGRSSAPDPAPPKPISLL